MNTYLVILNVFSLIVSLGLAYFAIRLLQVFRGGKMEMNWIYISLGVSALATSSFIFALYYILALPSIAHPIAGIIMIIGGLFILVGLREEYKKWTQVR